VAGPRLPGPEAGAVAAAGEHEQVGAFCGSGDDCTVLTAAPAYMSLTAVRTGPGAGGRSGPAGWPLDEQEWSMMASARLGTRCSTSRA
jgi:hypothetical protein